MKKLVVAEYMRDRVRAAPRIDDPTGGVNQSAGDEQRHRRGVEMCDELWQNGDGRPAEGKSDCDGEPFRRSRPDKLEHDRGQGADPHNEQDRRPPGAA